VCITFDDGFRSVHFHALPVLREFGFVGTAFVPTAFLSPPRPLSWRGYDDLPVVQGDEMAPMSWGELHELGTAGWEIGSHTRTHPHLLEVEDAVLNDELVRSRTELEAGMGAPATSIAYPYGEVDRRVRDAAAAAGYAAAAALGPQVRRGDPLRWPRVGIYRADNLSRFRLKTTRVMCSAPAAAVINIVRSLQGRA
jgi:peptidoglycan/xylan/chitin deacetylase (PgdA/CDA1 family)